MSTRRARIGVFDSGVGGLTVLKALLEVLPDADYAYFGDTARLPYGSKSVETVTKYALGAAEFLQQYGTDMLVIACNTATALALLQIERAARVPVVGVVEPGAKNAAEGNAECASRCVKEHGAKYVFVNEADKKVYAVDSQDKVAPHAGHHVVVKGTMNGNMLKLASIEMAK